jgi:hypothetical protein
LNGIKVGDRIIKVDHVEQYRIPKEYLLVDDEDGNEKIYKPTGPDGKGWGEFRELSPEDEDYFEELKEAETEKIIKQNIQLSQKTNFIVDADELWEKQFEDIVDKQKEEEENTNKLLSKKKELKKEKKRLKNEKKQEKKLAKEKKREDELIEIYKSYGVSNIEEMKKYKIDQ